jgi:hypothetical protein
MVYRKEIKGLNNGKITIQETKNSSTVYISINDELDHSVVSLIEVDVKQLKKILNDF